jgi:hypothetical protein
VLCVPPSITRLPLLLSTALLADEPPGVAALWPVCSFGPLAKLERDELVVPVE